jgi:hypothetical protein
VTCTHARETSSVPLESDVADKVDGVITQALFNLGRIEPTNRPREIAIGFGDPGPRLMLRLSIAGHQRTSRARRAGESQVDESEPRRRGSRRYRQIGRHATGPPAQPHASLTPASSDGVHHAGRWGDRDDKHAQDGRRTTSGRKAREDIADAPATHATPLTTTSGTAAMTRPTRCVLIGLCGMRIPSWIHGAEGAPGSPRVCLADNNTLSSRTTATSSAAHGCRISAMGVY